MPVHKVGYRGWDGQKTAFWSRWWIITETGFRISFASSWVRRIMLASWVVVLYFAIALFFVEQAISRIAIEPSPNIETPESSEGFAETIEEEVGRQLSQRSSELMLRQLEPFGAILPGQSELLRVIRKGDSNEIRYTFWSWMMLIFLRVPQGAATLFLIGFVVPTLISQDVRSRAFLLYFSRPIGRIEYIFGKFMIPAIFISLVTFVPLILLFGFGLALSPDFTVFGVTWTLLFKIVAASAFAIVSTCSIALMLSSVTQESRFATFAWFAVWALGHGAWFAIVTTQAIRMELPPTDERVLSSDIVESWSVVSLYNNLASVQSWIFGVESFSDVWVSVAALIAVTFVSLIILYRGVSAPINV